MTRQHEDQIDYWVIYLVILLIKNINFTVLFNINHCKRYFKLAKLMSYNDFVNKISATGILWMHNITWWTFQKTALKSTVSMRR